MPVPALGFAVDKPRASRTTQLDSKGEAFSTCHLVADSRVEGKMTAKVRIKAGPIEFEYEGETEFSISDIKDLFSHIETLFTVPSLATPTGQAADEKETGVPSGGGSQFNGTKLHINSIAAKLGGGSGTELALAAAAYLQLMEGKESFTRSELLKTMQAATLHYKKTMSNNLSKSISTLVGDKLNQLGQDKYSLTSGAYGQVEAQLAQ